MVSQPTLESWRFFPPIKSMNSSSFRTKVRNRSIFLFLSSPTPKVARLVGWPVCARKRLVRRCAGPTRHIAHTTATRFAQKKKLLAPSSQDAYIGQLHVSLPKYCCTESHPPYLFTPDPCFAMDACWRETFRHPLPPCQSKPPVVRGASLSHALDSAD